MTIILLFFVCTKDFLLKKKTKNTNILYFLPHPLFLNCHCLPTTCDTLCPVDETKAKRKITGAPPSPSSSSPPSIPFKGKKKNDVSCLLAFVHSLFTTQNTRCDKRSPQKTTISNNTYGKKKIVCTTRMPHVLERRCGGALSPIVGMLVTLFATQRTHT